MRSKAAFLGAVAALGLVASATVASATVYQVNRTIGAGSVIGSIETDGVIGVVLDGNIVDFKLTLTDTNGSFFLDGFSNAAVAVVGTAFTATATDLLFDFDAGSGFVLFQNPVIGSSINFWCLDNGSCSNNVVPGENVVTSDFIGGEIASRSGNVVIGSVSTGVVPLPAALPLLGAAVVGLGLIGRRRRAA